MAAIDLSTKNTFPSTLACFNGLWQVFGKVVETPPVGSDWYTSFYLKNDGKFYYGYNGEEHELRTGADVRFPTWQPGYPPVDGPDLIPGDFWDGAYGTDPVAIQHAIKTGNPGLPFAVIRGQKVPYEGGDGSTLNSPIINSAVYAEGTGITLTFTPNNSAVSRLVLYKSENTGAFVQQDLSLLSTTYPDTAVTAGKQYRYYLIAWSGTAVSPQSNTVSVSVPVNSLLLQFTVISPPGYANTIIKAQIANPSNAAEPIKYNWSVVKGDFYAGGQWIGGAYDDFGAEPGVGVFVKDLARYNLVPGDTYRLYLDESLNRGRENWVEFTIPEPNTVPAESQFASASWVSGSVTTSDLKIHIRANGGRKPFTFVLKNLSGTVVETRSGSNKTEEIFSQNLTGYAWSITDADNKVSNDSIDAESFKAYVTPIRAVTSLFGKASEQVIHFDTWGGINGMNAVGTTFNAFEYMQERLPISDATRQARLIAKPDERARWDDYTSASWQGFDNVLWTQEYDHTVAPTGGYAHPFDEVVRRAYTWRAFDPDKRLGMKLGFWANRAACTCSDRYPEYDFAYSTADGQKTKEGASHISAAKENQYLCLLNSSFASDAGRLYWTECLKKFCKRYRKAINDGTIVTISFCMGNTGEELPATTFYGADNQEHYGFGDFSPVMRSKFAAWMSMWFNGNIATFNTTFQTSFNAFTSSQFSSEILYNGPLKLKQHYAWFQMLQMAEFTSYMRKEVYNSMAISRKKFWTIDVGGWFDPLIFVNKTADFVRRLSIQPNILFIKGNNNPEGDDAWVTDQINSVAHTAGAKGVWEVSPTDVTWTNFVNGVKHAMEAGLGISGFPANGGGIDPVTGWQNIANTAETSEATGKVKMATYTKYPEISTLDASGNPRRATVYLRDFIMEGQPDPDSVIRPVWPVPPTSPKSAWQTARTANGNLPTELYVDSSGMFSDFPAAS